MSTYFLTTMKMIKLINTHSHVIFFFFGPLVRYYATFLRSERSWKKSGGFACRHETAPASGACALYRGLCHFVAAAKTPTFFQLCSLRKKLKNIYQWGHKKISPKKNITKNEVIIQRKHHYLFNKAASKN